jgi:hypothetical protein
MAKSFTANASAREIQNILVSTEGHEIIYVNVSKDARDAVGGHTPTTVLRQGLVLCKITSGPEINKYKEFDNSETDGSEDESTAVILEHDLEIDTVNGTVAAAYFKGTFARRLILAGSGIDYSNCQRLAFRDDHRDGF